MINRIYNKLKNNIGNNIELIKNYPYYGKYTQGILIYFSDGTTYQIFEDIDNKECSGNGFILVDSVFFPIIIDNDIEEFILQSIIAIDEKSILLKIEELKMELLNKKMDAKTLNNIMVKHGFYDNMNDLNQYILDCNYIYFESKKINDEIVKLDVNILNKDKLYFQIKSIQ